MAAPLMPEPLLRPLTLPGLHVLLPPTMREARPITLSGSRPSGRALHCVPAAAGTGVILRARAGGAALSVHAPDPCLGTSHILVLTGRLVLRPKAWQFLVLLTLCAACSEHRAFPGHCWEPLTIF